MNSQDLADIKGLYALLCSKEIPVERVLRIQWQGNTLIAHLHNSDTHTYTRP